MPFRLKSRTPQSLRQSHMFLTEHLFFSAEVALFGTPQIPRQKHTSDHPFLQTSSQWQLHLLFFTFALD